MSQPPAPAPRPQTFEEEWDDPAMAQFKREEAEDRAAFGQSEESRAWLQHMQSDRPRWTGSVRPAPKLPQYDRPPVKLNTHAAHA